MMTFPAYYLAPAWVKENTKYINLKAFVSELIIISDLVFNIITKLHGEKFSPLD